MKMDVDVNIDAAKILKKWLSFRDFALKSGTGFVSLSPC